jgi:hypothetical protein
MDWLRRVGRTPAPAAKAPDEPASEGVERATPGIAAFFDRIVEERESAVLDLGAADNSSLRVYSRYARWVRFADLLAEPIPPGGWESVLRALPSHPERPYDLVLAWDVLDHTPPEVRPRLIERVAEISSPHARLFVVVDTSGSSTTQPIRFSLLDIDRMRYEVAGPAQPGWPPLLPAEVERLLVPFQVVRAFTSQVGLREYVAVRKPER